jgi:multimeric flavodoxin WrbA
VMALSSQHGHDVMLLSSHASDDTAKSCWQWRCRCNVGHDTMLLPRRLDCDATLLSIHVRDGAAESC